ncbi:hypothetical protein HCA58_08130 [Micromonospora sp. HNM0581]|nr:hypothetical protein [Micromonospora sp. HNM0581]NLU78348.1 hypothetical protein [Micromonospora sp. HNM0581]
MTAAWLINVALAEWIIRRRGGTAGSRAVDRGQRRRPIAVLPAGGTTGSG